MPEFRKLVVNLRLLVSVVIYTLYLINADSFLVGDRVAFAQSLNPIQKPSTTKVRKPSSNGWLIEKIVELLSPTRGRADRGDGVICTDSPIFKSQYPYLWTRQPLFVWTGTAKSVRTLDATSKRVIWSKDVDAKTHKQRLDRPLAFGKRYIWQVVTDPDNELVNPKVEFQIVDAAQWKKIDRELKTLNRQWTNQKLDSEQIALERVKYFAQRQMWGDVTEIVNSLPDEVRESRIFSDLNKAIANELGECIRL
jgi:hypothetical protein